MGSPGATAGSPQIVPILAASRRTIIGLSSLAAKMTCVQLSLGAHLIWSDYHTQSCPCDSSIAESYLDSPLLGACDEVAPQITVTPSLSLILYVSS